MNKAFLREPEQIDSRCPGCQSVGQAVGPATLDARLSADARRALADSAYFCPNGRCQVVYYDDFASIVTRDAFPEPIPINDADAPLCSCFGVTRSDIEADVEEGVVSRTRTAVLKAQSDQAKCAILAPNGRSCVPEVQGHYIRCKQRATGK
jgi:hypothetical protein